MRKYNFLFIVLAVFILGVMINIPNCLALASVQTNESNDKGECKCPQACKCGHCLGKGVKCKCGH